MNNLYRKNPIFVQNRFNRFHHFSIGFTQLSNLFQPFAVGSNQCLAYYGLCYCFFTGFQQFFSIYCYHGLSSIIQSISSVSASTFISFYFLVYWNKKIQGSSLLNNALSGAGSDQLPSWDDFVRAIFWQVYACLLYTSPSPRDGLLSRMPSSA